MADDIEGVFWERSPPSTALREAGVLDFIVMKLLLILSCKHPSEVTVLKPKEKGRLVL